MFQTSFARYFFYVCFMKYTPVYDENRLKATVHDFVYDLINVR